MPIPDQRAPEPTRTVPDEWIEIPPHFTLEVEHGLHAGWVYINQAGFGEAVMYTPPDGGAPRAWSVRRERILGEPMPIELGGEITSTTPV